MEPNIQCTKALHFPTSGIVEPASLVNKLGMLSRQNGAYHAFGNEVVDIKPKGNGAG